MGARTFADEVDRDIPDYNVYLVGGEFRHDQVDVWLNSKYEDIFRNELNEWIGDQGRWPQNRTREMFTGWFEVIYFGLVYDMEKGMVGKY